MLIRTFAAVLTCLLLGAGSAMASNAAQDVPPAESRALPAPPTVVAEKVALEFVGMSKGQPVYYVPALNMHVIRIPRLDEIASQKKAPKP